MRFLFIALLVASVASLYPASANAYTIHNLTGIKAKFHGEYCFPCFEGWIEDGESKSCPGDKTGCGGNTHISINRVDGYRLATYFGSEKRTCVVYSEVNVTAHGDLYAYKDHVEVRDDNGKYLYNGPWSFRICDRNED
jgi:hypothetical protein